MEFHELRDRLVLAALPHVVFDGWSAGALAEAARDEGLDATMPERAFPGGPADAVENFVRMADRVMMEDLAAMDLESKRVGERIFLAVRTRLERWSPHKEAVRRALSVLALPQNLPLAARLTWGTVDAMWLAAGDAAHDFSWYTKRSTLAAVYSSTVLYWLDDPSEADAETWNFLKRRLGDVRKIPEIRARVEGLFSKLPIPGRLPLPKGRFGAGR